MEFNRLLSSAISTYGEIEFSNNTKSSNKEEKNYKISNKNYELIESEEDIDKWLNEAEESGEIAVDTETSSLDPHQAKLVGISFSSKIGKACYIHIGHTEGKNLEEKKVIKKIKPVLEDKSIKKIGQNIKFDYIIFYHKGINMNAMEDTMLMSYVLDAGKNRHNMDTLSKIHLDHKTIAFKDIVGTGKKQINFSEVKINIAKDYAAEDADKLLDYIRFFLKI